MSKIKNGFNSHNRITFYDDFAVGQMVWLFYHFENSSPNVCEGIVEGKIVEFFGYALDVAEIAILDSNKEVKFMKAKVNCFNHIDLKKGI